MPMNSRLTVQTLGSEELSISKAYDSLTLDLVSGSNRVWHLHVNTHLANLALELYLLTRYLLIEYWTPKIFQNGNLERPVLYRAINVHGPRVRLRLSYCEAHSHVIHIQHTICADINHEASDVPKAQNNRYDIGSSFEISFW